MHIGYPPLTIGTPGVRRGELILVGRGEICPILIGTGGLACPCDGMYDLIDDLGEEFADEFEFSVLGKPLTELGVIRESMGIHYCVAVIPTN